MLLDLIDLDKLRRGILYLGILFLTLLVQELLLSRIRFFGIRALVVPLLPVMLSLLQGPWWGMIFGLLAGVLTDAMFAETTVLFTIMLPLVGFLTAAAERFLISRRLVAVVAASVAALLLTALAQALRVLVLFDGEALPLLRVAALQILWSVPFIFVLYFPCKALAEKNLD
jgi:cell shape-determining protein MreD